MFAAFFPDNHPALLSNTFIEAHKEITTPPTHVSMAYTEIENLLDARWTKCPPHIAKGFLKLKWSEDITFIWHWRNDNCQPFHSLGYCTDFMCGISMWRNSDNKLHRIGSSAIIRNNVDIKNSKHYLYTHPWLFHEFIKISVDNLDECFNYSELDIAYSGEDTQSIETDTTYKFIQSFMNGENWYAYNGNRIFINYLDKCAFYTLSNIDNYEHTINMLNSVIYKLKERNRFDINKFIPLIKRWSIIRQLDFKLLCKDLLNKKQLKKLTPTLIDANVMTDNELMYLSVNRYLNTSI